MPVLIAVLLLTWMVKKAVGDTIVDNNLAKQGIVSPRVAGRHGVDAAGKVAKYGLTDHLRDNWRDLWARRTDALIAARDARDLDGDGRISLRERWAAAKNVMTRVVVKVKDHPAVRAVVTPIGEDRAPARTSTVEPAAPTDPEPGTVRFADDGREQWTGTEWGPDPDAPIETATVVDTVVLPKTAPKEPPMASPTTTSNGSTPSGEATGVAGGAGQARGIRIAALALRETTVAKLKELAAAAETLEASGAGMEIDPATMAEIARAREAIAALMAALTGAAEEVDGSMTAVEKEFNKHLPGVDFNASVGGMARKGAYDGN